MIVLILGSTGMLGQALLREARLRNFKAIGIARKGADINIDIRDDLLLTDLIKTTKPDVIINTVAIVDLEDCNKNPSQAYLVNARPASILSDFCYQSDTYYVHVSTDHYYTQDKDKKHDEKFPIKILNEYARTKYAGECFALNNPRTLVVRTNIVGFRYNKFEQPTFVEWIIKSVEEDAAITMFDDYFASSIDVVQFSRAIFDLIANKPSGLMNVACRDVRNKKQFIETIAQQLNRKLSKAVTGSILNLRGVPRAYSLGLDVAKAESILGYALPTFEQVITSLINEYNHHKVGSHNEV